MKKEHWEYLKENDPIHYSEMMGDPVTGQGTSKESISILAILFGVFGLINLGYFFYKLFTQ